MISWRGRRLDVLDTDDLGLVEEMKISVGRLHLQREVVFVANDTCQCFADARGDSDIPDARGPIVIFNLLPDVRQGCNSAIDAQVGAEKSAASVNHVAIATTTLLEKEFFAAGRIGRYRKIPIEALQMAQMRGEGLQVCGPQ